MKTDYKKELKKYYSAPVKNAELIDVPEFNYLMADGEGDPNNSQLFQDAAARLYGLSYTIKFMIKKQTPEDDYSVMPLQGLWRADDMDCFLTGSKDAWKWTLMILQPGFVTSGIVEKAKTEAEKKKGVSFSSVRFEKYTEGLSAQIMHIGPYAEEEPTVKKLHSFIDAEGYKKRGLHHEIYLGDPRKSDPSKLKTIIRQPVA